MPSDSLRASLSLPPATLEQPLRTNVALSTQIKEFRSQLNHLLTQLLTHETQDQE